MSKATVVLLLLVVAAVGNATAHKRQPRIIKHNGVVGTDDERCSEIGMHVFFVKEETQLMRQWLLLSV